MSRGSEDDVTPELPSRVDDAASTPEPAPPLEAAIDAALASEEEEYQSPPLGPIASWVRHVAIIGVFPGFALFYLWQSLTITLPKRVLLVSPRGFPTTVAIAMVAVTVALAALEVIGLVRQRRAARTGETFTQAEDDDRERISSWRDAWVTLGALVVYIAVFAFLGFAIATFVFLAGVSTYLSPRQWIRNVVVSALFSVAVYILFSHLLGVQLPGGLIAGIF
jgi:putative tricarboxylic transport membrane protein